MYFTRMMWFKKNILLIILVLTNNQILVTCFPRTITKNPCEKENNLFPSKNFASPSKICEGNNEYHFSEIEHLPASNKMKNNIISHQRPIENVPALPPEFSSGQSYREFGNFPDVEYPLSASELWKPNFWHCQSSHSELVKSDQPVGTDKELIKNNKIYRNSGIAMPLSTMSFSDPKKNLVMLRNKEGIKNDHCNEQINKEIVCKSNTSSLLPLDLQLINVHTTAAPYLYTQYSNENISDRNTFIKKSEVASNFDKLYLNNNKHEQIMALDKIIKAHADKFNVEMTSILKSIADIIIKEKNNESKNKVDRLPDLDGNSYNSKCEEKLKSLEDVMNSYGDKLNTMMAETLQTVADNIILEKFNETLDTVSTYDLTYLVKTDHNKYEKDFSNIAYDSKFEITENTIKSHADKFNEEISLFMKAAADDILLLNFGCPKINYDSYRSAQMNEESKNIYDDLNIEGNFDKSPNCKYSSVVKKIEGGSENIIKNYADKFNDKMTSVLSSVVNDILSKNYQSPNELFQDYIGRIANNPIETDLLDESAKKQDNYNYDDNIICTKSNSMNANKISSSYISSNNEFDENRTFCEDEIIYENNPTYNITEDKSIINEEDYNSAFNDEYTTDAYSENEYFNTLSTAAPMTNIVDINQPEVGIF